MFLQHFSFAFLHHMPIPPLLLIIERKKDPTPYRAKSLALPPDFTYRKYASHFRTLTYPIPFYGRLPSDTTPPMGFAPPLEGPFNRKCSMEVSPFFHSL